jgi:gliding motility-associated-like protein
MFLRILFISFFVIVCLSVTHTQILFANAGPLSVTICPNSGYTLGANPSASGGIGPYTYNWSPATGLSSTSSPNPTTNITQSTQYVLTVTDDDDNIATDTIFVLIDPIANYNAGNDTVLCSGSQGPIGAITNSTSGNVTYSWSPASGLSSTTDPRPICSATITTVYTLTITSPTCPPQTSSVLVTIQNSPIVAVTPIVSSINEGQTAVLIASGAQTYFWSPSTDLSDANSALVNATPVTTTTYTVTGFDAWGCSGYASATVNVHPAEEVYYYNSFSPNGDGINDFFHIGNIEKYPKSRLEVFSRTGQLVYSKTNYLNNWDGTNDGDRLPDATYYFVLDLGNGQSKIYSSVTIVR